MSSDHPIESADQRIHTPSSPAGRGSAGGQRQPAVHEQVAHQRRSRAARSGSGRGTPRAPAGAARFGPPMAASAASTTSTGARRRTGTSRSSTPISTRIAQAHAHQGLPDGDRAAPAAHRRRPRRTPAGGGGGLAGRGPRRGPGSSPSAAQRSAGPARPRARRGGAPRRPAAAASRIAATFAGLPRRCRGARRPGGTPRAPADRPAPPGSRVAIAPGSSGSTTPPGLRVGDHLARAPRPASPPPAARPRGPRGRPRRAAPPRLTMARASQAATQSATAACGQRARAEHGGLEAQAARPRRRRRGASGPSPTNASRASGRAPPAPARRPGAAPAGSCARSGPPTASTSGPPGARPRRARAAARSPGAKRSRLTPMSTTCSGGSASPVAPELARPGAGSRRSRAAARRSGPAVARRTDGRSRLRTSWPWAVTTKGMPAAPGGQASGRPGREQVVGVDHVGPPGGAHRPGGERRVLGGRAHRPLGAPVDRRPGSTSSPRRVAGRRTCPRRTTP